MPSKREAMTARALALVGCGYIYGATGWVCTPGRLARQEKQYPAFAAQMKRYGGRWMGKPCYDCAQLTRDVAKRAGVDPAVMASPFITTSVDALSLMIYFRIAVALLPI